LGLALPVSIPGGAFLLLACIKPTFAAKLIVQKYMALLNGILNDQLVETLNENNISELNDLQQLCVPKIKSGNDLLCVAPEGYGKSTTIVTTVLQKLKQAVHDNPRAVIVVPDTARAEAMFQLFQRLGYYTDLRVRTACENEKIDDQKDRIYMGSDVVIGTLKRLTQIYSMYALNLSVVKMLIIDDAEGVLRNMNLVQMIRLTEGPVKTQHIVFATRYSEWVERYADKVLSISEVIQFENE
jgi:ATP-dependent RNA helicase RhlE